MQHIVTLFAIQINIALASGGCKSICVHDQAIVAHARAHTHAHAQRNLNYKDCGARCLFLCLMYRLVRIR